MSKRNSRRNQPSKTLNINDEVQSLLRKSKNNKISHSELNILIKRYNDNDIAQQIQNQFIIKYEKISKRANKFAQIIASKYGNSPIPYHSLLDKAIKYKQIYNLSDDEFALFRRIYELALRGEKKEEVFTPVTNLSKILGSPDINWSGNNEFNVSDNEYKYLQEILKIESESRTNHRNAFIQSLTYEDCDHKVLNRSKFEPNLGHQMTTYIHPVISALFTPKIDVIETRFIHSNIAALIASRYNKKAIGSRSNFELLHDLRIDPNDIVCDNSSPMLDLLNRCKLQSAIWNNVLNLRNGQVFKSSSIDLISAIDMCRINKNDTPGLLYGRNDATVIKRLISAFSFRPTIIVSMPLYPSNPFTSYNVNVKPTINSISMINLRIPENVANDGTYSVGTAVQEQKQLIILPNNQYQYSHSQIKFSRGVIIFYIDRRVNYIKLSNYEPFSLDNLPKAMIGLEKIRDTKIQYDQTISISSEKFNFKSALCTVKSENITNNKSDKYLLGSKAVFKKNNNDNDNDEDNNLCYNPLEMIKSIKDSNEETDLIQTPFNRLLNIKDEIERNGYLLIYEKNVSENN